MKTLDLKSIIDALMNNALTEKLKSLSGKISGLSGVGGPQSTGSGPNPDSTFGNPQLPIKLRDTTFPPNWPLIADANSNVSVATRDNFICLIADRDSHMSEHGAVYGTGFHIGGNWILTAHHVLPDVEFLTGQRAWFVADSGFVAHEFSADTESYYASLDGIMATDGYSYEFDYAVAKLTSPLLPTLVMSEVDLANNQSVDILRPVREGNSNGNPVNGFGIVRSLPSFDKTKRYDKVEALEDKLIFHSCSSYPGDSGAPIIDGVGRVVGIHTHEYQPNLGATEHKRNFNWGTSIRAIATDLRSRAPSIHAQCVSLHKIAPVIAEQNEF